MDVLIAGQAATNQDLITGICRLTGLTCHTAVTASEAVDQLEAHPGIALAVIDADLPGTGAFPLIHFIRMTYPLSLRIVLLATFSLPVMHLALQSGCSELIAKPCSLDMIKTFFQLYQPHYQP